MNFRVLLVIAALFLYGTFAFFKSQSTEHVFIVPLSVEERIKTNGEGVVETIYYLNAKDMKGNYKEYKIKDEFIALHFSSWNVKNFLKDNIGTPLECVAIGWRVNILSMYPNVIECKEFGS